MPMSSSQSGSRFGSPSDYYSESESTGRGGGGNRSRIGRLTPTAAVNGGASTSSRPPSRSASRPASRHGSDLAYGLDRAATSRSSDNLRRAE